MDSLGLTTMNPGIRKKGTTMNAMIHPLSSEKASANTVPRRIIMMARNK
jgi:hypothetical protein